MWTSVGFDNGFYLTVCSCGAEGKVRKYDWEHAKSKMCNSCSRRKAATRHGYKGTRVYRIWKGMRTRCNNPNTHDYKYYGAKGISVCKRWNVFENFLKDMGEPPSDEFTLDRINPFGIYEPSNCRWVTWEVQKMNKRANFKEDEYGTRV